MGSFSLIVGLREKELITGLHGRCEPVLRDDGLHGGRGLSLLDLARRTLGALGAAGAGAAGLALLLGVGIIRRASSALEILQTSLKLLAYNPPLMSVLL